MNSRHKLILAVTAGALAVLALVGHLIWSGYREAVKSAEVKTSDYAAIIEARLDASLRHADAALQALAHKIPLEALDQKAVPLYARDLDVALDLELVNFAELAGLRIADASGNILYTSDSAGTARVQIADRGYFRALSDNPKAGTVFSEVITARTTGRRSVVLARAIRDEQGVFRGIAYALLELEHFQKLFKSLDVGTQGNIAIYRRDDFTQVLRWPEVQGKVNTPLPQGNPARTTLVGGNRTATREFYAATDGKLRTYSFHALDPYPFFVAVGVAREDTLVGWRTRSLAVGLAALVLLGLLISLLMRLERAHAVQAQLAVIVDASHDAIVSRDRNGKIISWNHGAEMLFGYSAEQMIGRDISALAPPALHHELRMGQEENPDFGARSHESVRLAKDGRMIDVSISAAPIRDAGVSVSGIALIFRDVSERKQSEVVRAQLAAIVENANDAIFNRALDGTILSWNAGAHRMLGYTAEEAIGNTIAFTLPLNRPSNLERNNAALLRGEVVARESERLTKDGRVISVLASHSPIRDGTGNIVGASIIMQDITGIKHSEAARTVLEAQLREAQKMQAIGTLAGGIAHDFNNIIAAILGNTELAYQDAAANPAVLESLEEIRKAGTRARDLVQQILAFSRRQPTERKPTALAPVIQDCVRLLRATLPARIVLEAQCDPEVPLAQADANLIQQALINLATNAMQAMRGRSGLINIRLDTMMLDGNRVQAHPALRGMHAIHPGLTVRLAVSDDGPGIDPNYQGRIFEPFFTTKPLGEGTGLGLSVVHGIVQTHEGALEVESQPGHGATFTIYLPLAEERRELAKPGETIANASQAIQFGNGEHILYLDDDGALVSLVKRLLERRGYRVSAYSSQDEALAALRMDPTAFDLVLTDYNMPGMSGLDVAREVRVIRADLPVAMTSGFIDETARAQAADAGVRDLIFKADAVELFCATIQQLMETVGKKSRVPKT